MATGQIFSCPGCGAPQTPNGAASTVKCPFCGDTVVVPRSLRTRAPAAPPPAPPPDLTLRQLLSPSPPPARAPAPIPPPAPRGGGCGWLILVILLVGGLSLYGSRLIPSRTSSVFTDTPGPTLPPRPLTATVLLTFGGQGSAAGRLDGPTQLAVDGAGNVYVAERARGRVQKFDAQGHFLNGWTIAGQALDGLAADRAGTVYVVQGGSLAQYSGATGALLATGAGPARYIDIALLPDGRLLGAPLGGPGVVRLDPRAGLDLPAAILPEIAGAGPDIRLAADPAGGFWVLGRATGTVYHFAAGGAPLGQFGGIDAEPRRFVGPPLALAVDRTGHLYVADAQGIQVFEADGRYRGRIPPPAPGAAATGLASGDAGTLFVVSGPTAQVFKLAIALPPLPPAPPTSPPRPSAPPTGPPSPGADTPGAPPTPPPVPATAPPRRPTPRATRSPVPAPAPASPTPVVPVLDLGGTATLDAWVISLARLDTRSRLVYSDQDAYRPSGHFYLLWIDARNLQNATSTLRSDFTWQLVDDHGAIYDELSNYNADNLAAFANREGRDSLDAVVTPRALTHPLLAFDIAADARPVQLLITGSASGAQVRFHLPAR